MASITRKISEGTFLMFFQKALTIVLGVSSTVLVLRALGIREYGLVVLALSIVNIFSIFLDFGIGSVVVSDTAKELGSGNLPKIKKLLTSYSKSQIITGVFLSAVVFGFSFLSKAKYGAEVSDLLKIASLLIFLNGVKNIFVTAFYGFSKFKFLAALNFLEGLFKFLLTLFLIFILHGSMRSVMAINLLALAFALFSTAPFLIKIFKTLKGVSDFKESLFFNLLRGHGKFQALIRPLSNLSDPLRMWIIQYFAGVEAVAVYQVALKIYSYLSQLVYSVEIPLFSIISEELGRDTEKVKKIFLRLSKYFFWLSIGVMILSYIFIPFILHTFFGGKYDKSVPMLYFLLLTFIVGGFAVLIRPILFAFQAQKEILKADFFSLIIGYPISTYLTYLYGPVGFALPLGSYLSFYFRYISLKKIDKDFSFKLSNFLKWDKEDLNFLKRIYMAVVNRIKKTR